MKLRRRGLALALVRDPRDHRVPTSEEDLVAISQFFGSGTGQARPGQYPTVGGLEGEGLDAGAVPDTVTSCHSPPEAVIPLPLFCPGAVSAA